MTKRPAKRPVLFFLAAIFAAGLAAAEAGERTFPGKDPGPAMGVASPDGHRLTLSNEAISASWEIAGGSFRPASLNDRLGPKDRPLSFPKEAFVLVFRDGRILKASQMRPRGYMRVKDPEVFTNSSRLAERFPGKSVAVGLETADGSLRVKWRAVLRDGSNSVRQEIVLEPAGRDADIAQIILIDWILPGAEIAGKVAGSPVVARGVFTGFEHPMSVSEVTTGKNGEPRVVCRLDRALPLQRGQTFACSSVTGVAPEGQLRRAFLYYLERERAHPYRPFLNYNSWYDIRGAQFNEGSCLEAIAACADELVTKRGVVLDSFLFDDGWDDTSKGGRWAFHSGFPAGFGPLREAAGRIGAAPGIWLSPWGGYGRSRKERVASARAAGFETDRNDKDPGLALSGPKYYDYFNRVCREMLTKYGINQFKFDGTGNINSVVPGSRFGSDFEAAIQLIRDLRGIKPDLYVNLTTGTWPSPFWLLICDSIWRGGSDFGFTGVGSDRRRWMTFRDAETYRGIVKSGPLFPISSLMLTGLIYGRYAKSLAKDPGDDFTAEVRSFFAEGTQLQELYISPGLLTAGNWDAIAEGAKWSRANAAILADTHWIGGNPASLDVYGWAAWAPEKGIFGLRNPDGKAREFDVALDAFFELPSGADAAFTLKSPYHQRPLSELEGRIDPRRPVKIRLEPFEVLVFEALPASY
jgi:hypothetical protein